MAFNRQYYNDRMFGGNYRKQDSEESETNSYYNHESDTSEEPSENNIYSNKIQQPKESAMSKYNVSNPNYYRPNVNTGSSNANKYSSFGDNKFSAKAGLTNLGAASNYGYNSNLDNYTNIDIDFNAINQEKEKKAKAQVKKPIEEDIDLSGIPGTKTKAKEEDKFFEDLQEELKKEDKEKDKEKKSIMNTDEDEYNFDNESLNNENVKSNNTSKNSINITHSEISSSYKNKKKNSDKKNISETLNEIYENSGNGFESISIDRKNNKFEYSQTGSKEIYNPDSKEEYLKKQEPIIDQKAIDTSNKLPNKEINNAENNHNKLNISNQNNKDNKAILKTDNNKSKLASEEEDYYDSKFDQLDEIANITSSENGHDELQKLRSESSNLGISSSRHDISEKKDVIEKKNTYQQEENIQFNKIQNNKINNENIKANIANSGNMDVNRINNNSNIEENKKSMSNSNNEDIRKNDSDINSNSKVKSNQNLNTTNLNNNHNSINLNNTNNEIIKDTSKNNIEQIPINNPTNQLNENINYKNQNIGNTNNVNNNYANNPNFNNFNNYQYPNCNPYNNNFFNNNFNPNFGYNNNPNFPGNNFYNNNPNFQPNNLSNYPNFPQNQQRFDNVTHLDNKYNRINDINLGNNNIETPQFNQQHTIIYEDQYKKSYNNISGYKSLYQDQIEKTRQQSQKSQIPNWNNNNDQTDIRDFTNLNLAAQEVNQKFIATQKIQNFLISPESKTKVFRNIFPIVNNFFSIYCFKVFVF